MGIRYYAYAFDAELARQVASDPWSVVSSDPLADAWGFEPHAAMAYPTFEQTRPKTDMLYLDKAWHGLQAVTRPADGETAGAAHLMFAGQITWTARGHLPWIRSIPPNQISAIRDDLRNIDESRVRDRIFEAGDAHDDVEYVLDYLARAQAFVEILATRGRGMVCLIQ